jgi:hypothetical protein
MQAESCRRFNRGIRLTLQPIWHSAASTRIDDYHPAKENMRSLPTDAQGWQKDPLAGCPIRSLTLVGAAAYTSDN